MGPPPRSFAADAHDCIMVRVLGPTEYKAVARLIRARKRAPPRIVVVWRTAGKARPTELACRRARDRQGQAASRWPAATLDRHCARRPIKARSGRGDDRHLGRTRRWKGSTIKLDNNCPIQGFRMKADGDDAAC